MSEKLIILQSLVGSRAHNLHSESSDYDYRAVHLLPTREILSLGFKYSGTNWIEGQVDETSYEIGHFLQLCTKANPSVLEVLVSTDIKQETPYAEEMRSLLKYMYNPQDAFNAFAGYSKNQQKKLLENHLNRREKFGVAYVRTSYNLLDLFETGCFSLRIHDEVRRQILLDIRAGYYSDGDIIDMAEANIRAAKELLPGIQNHQDINKVNDFLLKVRKENW